MESFDDMGSKIFKPYEPFPIFAKLAHPDKITQTVSLACVSVTPPSYKHSIPIDWLSESKSRLSGVQMDAIVLAGAAHDQFVNGARQGFILGDGTGVGKGREIVGMVADNWMKGRKKSIWISSSMRLFLDAQRDLVDVIGTDFEIPIHPGDKSGWSGSKDGIVFASYNRLSKQKGDEFIWLKKVSKWVGKDFDGLVILDEAHKAKGLIVTEVDSEGTRIGIAVEKIQKMLRNARFVYATATIGVVPSDLQYVKRIGLWDGEAGFGGKEAMDFFSERGLAGSELLAAQLKSRGVMVSRQLSYSDVKFDVIQCEHDMGFIQLFDDCSKLWRLILKTIKGTGNLQMAYWGVVQSFFKSMCIASKMPFVLNLIQTQLDGGRSVVVSLTSTHEELYKRFKNCGYHDHAVEVFRPCRQMLEEFLIAKLEVPFERLGLTPPSKPAYMEQDVEEDTDVGVSDEPPAKKRKGRAKGKGGNLDSKKKTTKSDPFDKDLVDEIISLFLKIGNKLPFNPLDIFVMKFGATPGIVELSSRCYSQQLEEDDKGVIRVDVEGKVKGKQLSSDFQSGSCRVAIISEASSTGISLHCSKNALNKEPRLQILLETPWTSLSALQSLGRTHRSGQQSLPSYILITSPFPGEERFVNAVAGRICSLGALCEADRRSSFNEAWKTFQICPQIAKNAIKNVLWNIVGSPSNINLFPCGIGNAKRNEWKRIVMEVRMVVESVKSKVKCVPNARLTNQEKFLNRLLVLEYAQQHTLMEFYKLGIERATEAAEMQMNDGVDALSSNVMGQLHFIKTLEYNKGINIACNIHFFKTTDVCTWEKVGEIGGPAFFQSNGGEIVNAKKTSDGSLEILKPQSSLMELKGSRYLLGFKKVEATEAKSIWEKQINNLLGGFCIKSAQGKCSAGANCKDTLHSKAVFEFALFTGVISTVLMDLIEIVGENEMRLVHHSWDNKSDIGILIYEQNIKVVQECLLKVDFQLKE